MLSIITNAMGGMMGSVATPLWVQEKVPVADMTGLAGSIRCSFDACPLALTYSAPSSTQLLHASTWVLNSNRKGLHCWLPNAAVKDVVGATRHSKSFEV